MNPIQVTGLVSLLFGVLVLIYPEILTALVAIFFIVVGLNAIIFGTRANHWFKR